MAQREDGKLSHQKYSFDFYLNIFALWNVQFLFTLSIAKHLPKHGQCTSLFFEGITHVVAHGFLEAGRNTASPVAPDR